MINLNRLFNTSRPRFWSYLAGTYLIGYTASAASLTDLLRPTFLYMLFFFLFPANFFLYGISDYYDRTLEHLGRRKKKHEVTADTDINELYKHIFICLLFAVPPLVYLSYYPRMILIGFLLLSAFYSAPPIRFKTMPFFDSAANILYVLPGFLGYSQNTDVPLSITTIAAMACWPVAMYLFTGIFDRENATVRYAGAESSLLLTSFLWLLFALYAISVNILFFPVLIYPVIPFLLLMWGDKMLDSIYWRFPLINAALGIALFLFLIYTKYRV